MAYRCLIGLGSNHEAEINIGFGAQALWRRWPGIELSESYFTEPVGEGAGTRVYLNCCAVIECHESEVEIKRDLRRIELASGERVRSPVEPVRPLDLDILAYGEGVSPMELRGNPALAAFEGCLDNLIGRGVLTLDGVSRALYKSTSSGAGMSSTSHDCESSEGLGGTDA